LKPISYEDFLKSTDKAYEWFSISMKQDIYKRDRFMLVKSEYKLLRVCLDDILYIEGKKDYVWFYLKNGEVVQSLMSMKKLDDFLPKPEFLRTHRSFIVHMPEAQLIDRFRIIFGDVYIPISENYKEDVLTYLDQHTLG
jgi:DNA-binding LytR/AlgR family response regulator